MAKGYTIANENIDFDLLRKSYFSAKSFDQRFNWGDLDLILKLRRCKTLTKPCKI